ncbi:MAG TPA: flagellar hook basal-body protein [Steroidobacteraceae bacterium]|nr:flagellar hook basal-body protein [Steroidobacteraceae bacterium]
MSSTLQTIGAAMRAEADALRLSSINIANADTPAYRRQVMASQPMQAQFDSVLNQATTGATLQPIVAATTTLGIDMRPGTLKSTQEPLNVALDGSGFFVVQGSNDGGDVGSLLLTRRGDLHVSADGVLVTSTGAPILGAKGPIVVGTSIPTISADGSVRIDNQIVDELRIANVADGSKLQPLGDGTYRAAAADATEGERVTSVRQGFLETSNVAQVNEVVQLMETMRRFESEQKVALAYDGMLDKAISALGKVR